MINQVTRVFTWTSFFFDLGYRSDELKSNYPDEAFMHGAWKTSDLITLLWRQLILNVILTALRYFD